MNGEQPLICSPNIDWLTEADISAVIEELRYKYSEDPINIISYNAIGYICKLDAVSNFYNDDVLKLAAVICRSVIQGHPLQDGNKRLGMYLISIFLELNNIQLNINDKEYVEIALKLAKDEMDLETLYEWISANTKSH